MLYMNYVRARANTICSRVCIDTSVRRVNEIRDCTYRLGRKLSREAEIKAPGGANSTTLKLGITSLLLAVPCQQIGLTPDKSEYEYYYYYYYSYSLKGSSFFGGWEEGTQF